MANQGGAKVVVSLSNGFRNVDEVRIIYANSLGWAAIDDIVLRDPVALPVKLVSFKANASEIIVSLNWTTAEEINTSHFEIQRSSDGKTFESIGTLDASPESKQTRSYHFSEPFIITPLSSRWYYRLKMVNYNRSYAYSSVKSIDRVGEDLAFVYPQSGVTKALHKSAVERPTEKCINHQFRWYTALQVFKNRAEGNFDYGIPGWRLRIKSDVYQR